MTGVSLGKCGILALVLALSAGMAGADWAQMGGPNRDFRVTDTGIARTWPAVGPKVLWTVPLGAGYGSPAVRDGEVYVLDRMGDKQDNLRCLELAMGKELWNFAYDAPGSVSHDGSRTAPTVDETHVYSVGLMGHLQCVDRKTHQPVWSKNLLEDFGVKLPNWGVSQAPSLYKDLVIVAPQAPDAYVVAFNKDTGEIVWKSAGQGAVGYSTPVLLNLCGVDQVVMVGASTKDGSTKGIVAGISPENGATLWTYEGWQCFIPIPYATALPEDRVFITGGYKAGSAMVQVKKDGDAYTAVELWKSDVCGSQIQQPLFHDGHLYVNSNSNEREDGLMCLGLDGGVKWKTKDAWFSTSFERGPLMLADGLIINLEGKKGTLHLIEPSTAEYKELASFKILGGKEIWAPMALSGGKLLVRSQEEMKCLDLVNP